MVIKRSPDGQASCRWRAVNFDIHLWSSGKNADCIFGDRSASSMSKWRPAWTLTPEMIHFRTKSVTLSMLIDLLTSTMSCRSTQVKIASTDLWPQEMFTFSEMLALVESESSFGVYVCHRRPGGYRATSDLVDQGSFAKKRDENDVQKVWIQYFGVLHYQQGRYKGKLSFVHYTIVYYTILIYYKPRPRNYRVLHRALYNPRPAASGCMRGVKPDNFEAEACNIFKFFQLLSPVIEALSKSFFRRRKSCGE